MDYRDAVVRIAGRVLFLDEDAADYQASPDGDLQLRCLLVRQKPEERPVEILVKRLTEHNPGF